MLKREMILVLFMGMIVLMAIVFRSGDASPARTITVSAQSEVIRMSDAVSFDIEFRGTDMTSDDMDKLLFDAAGDRGIFETESVVSYTTNISIYSSGNFDGIPDLMNPTLRYRVSLYDLSLLDELIVELSQFEGVSVYSMFFFYTEADSLVQEAEDAALANARTEAGRIAEANNMSLGQVVSVSFSHGQGYNSVDSGRYDELFAASATDDLAFKPAPSQLSANAIVTFEMH